MYLRKGFRRDLVAYAKKKGVVCRNCQWTARWLRYRMTPIMRTTARPVRPTDIVLKQGGSNPKSADLRNAAAKLMN